MGITLMTTLEDCIFFLTESFQDDLCSREVDGAVAGDEAAHFSETVFPDTD